MEIDRKDVRDRVKLGESVIERYANLLRTRNWGIVWRRGEARDGRVVVR